MADLICGAVEELRHGDICVVLERDGVTETQDVCGLVADLLDAHARYLALLEAHANAAGLRDHELAERIRLRASAKDEIDAALRAFAAAILPTTEGTQR